MPKPYSKYKNKDGVVTTVGYMCRSCNTARLRKYRTTKTGKQKTYEANLRTSMKNPLHQYARSQVNKALKKELIIRPSNCSLCMGNTKLDAHHPNYSKPLDIVWLCRQCHAALHYENKN